MSAVVDSAKAILTANPGLPFIVYNFEDACAQNKVLDSALKQVRSNGRTQLTLVHTIDQSHKEESARAVIKSKDD
jgi:hypothetical protein